MRCSTLVALFCITLCSSLFADQPHISPMPPSQQVQQQQTPPLEPSTTTTPPKEHNPFDLKSLEEPQGEDHFFVEFMKMLANLGLLVALVLLGTWFLRRMVSKQINVVNSTSAIKITEKRVLTSKTTIYLLEIKGKEIAIAESHGGVTKLSEIGPEAPPKESFHQVLERTTT